MSATSLKPSDAARSKILRLPFADRMEFNRLVRDGFKGRALSAWLAEKGIPGVTAENLRKYRQSPAYRVWLSEESQVERDRSSTENAMRLAEALGGSASDKLKAILAGTLFRVMPNAGTEDTTRLVSALRAVTEAERLELQRRAADQRDEALALERQKFQSDTCELFLRWYRDARAADIANSKATNAEKIVALRKEFFRDVDEMEQSGKVKLPR